MELKNLGQTGIAPIVDCLVKAFEGYFVKMPNDVTFWNDRFRIARVDLNLSFGAFDQGKLVAFVIHGIDYHDNKKTAFNTGTGVLEAYRGQGLVDQIYQFAFPILHENVIEKCMLEVIDENHRAIKVYERIGFKKDRFLNCFSGQIKEVKHPISFEKINSNTLKEFASKYQKFYSWDNSLKAILKAPEMFSAFLVKEKNGPIILGYLVVNLRNKAFIQIESFDDQGWKAILEGTIDLFPYFKINNVDSNRHCLKDALNDLGIQNHINQYEMTLEIKG